jgi:cellulose synthase/poly-beta-1,6-N-acetylglucosamine synthase-like glycosyltransferase
MMHALFWLAIAWLMYVYLGYPLLLVMFGLFRRISLSTSESYLPKVSVLIAARNEEKDIGWKIRETLAWEYPADLIDVLVASDASEDRTDAIVQSIRDPRLRFIRLSTRSGKNTALNHLASIATGDLLMFTDANSGISPVSLRSMVRHFADPRVGCVTGWEGTAQSEVQALGVAGQASLDYESSINALESRLGTVLICDGSIFCIRRSLFRQLDPDLANDLELPLWVAYNGYKLLYEPNARSAEKPTSLPAEEFHRRRRICAQGVLGMWKLRDLLRGLRAWQFLSRKFLRWLTLVPMALILIASIALRGSSRFQLLIALEVCFCMLALWGWVAALIGTKSPRVISLPFFFMLLNLAALIGFVEACFGRRFAIWEVPTLSRGQNQVS